MGPMESVVWQRAMKTDEFTMIGFQTLRLSFWQKSLQNTVVAL
jgi:hypothetical protein